MLRIGNVELETNLLLAPIAGYCDLAFRLVCRAQGGVGLACTDLLSPQGLLHGTAASLDLAQTNELDSPVGMQLYGSAPAIMADGARWAVDHGATVIDINMGCPVDKVTKKDGGSKLLCDSTRSHKIVEAVRGAIDGRCPLTVKMRLGWYNDQPVARWLGPELVRAGAQAVTIHGRTTEQKFSGCVDLEGIRQVVEAVKAADSSVPVIGNGDIKVAQDAKAMIEATGCDGVMIGRGALGQPWIFRDVHALLTTGRVPEQPSPAQIVGMARDFFDLMRQHRDDHYAMHKIRQRISWLGKNLADAKGLKEAVRTAADPAAVYGAMAGYLEGLGAGDDFSQPAVQSARRAGVGHKKDMRASRSLCAHMAT